MSINADDYFAYERKAGSQETEWYTCKADVALELRCAKSGVASAEGCPPRTLPQLLKAAAEKAGSLPALKAERPCPEPNVPGVWQEQTWQMYYDNVRKVGKGFIKLGLQRFDSVAIWGFNSPEWMLASLAAGMAGGKSAGLYPTDAPETAAFKVVHSGSSIVVLEDKSKLERLQSALLDRQYSGKVKAFVAYGFEPAFDESVHIRGEKIPVISWASMLEMSNSVEDAELDARNKDVQPGQCAALVYTSGTTGEPKAVMISHDNVIFEATAVIGVGADHMGFCKKAEQERILSYLPLSHIAGLMVDIAFPIVATATSPAHVTTFFARPYDLKLGTLKNSLCVARPTAFLGVPLVWEKVADKLRALGASNPNWKKSLAAWAKDKGVRRARANQLGGDGLQPSGYGLANKVVLSKIKQKLGLDKVKFGITGAAPIRVDTLEYFGSLGLQINEVYGMSESTAAATVSTSKVHQWGSCGFQMPGVEVKAFKVDSENVNSKTECPRAPALDSTDEAFQGELCFRGRSIMMGYLAQPDLGPEHVKEIERKTAVTIDKDGWLHSGDKGIVTEAGMVKVTGRYKELIIGAGGENIAPVPIEDHIKASCDGINEVIMIGDKQKYNVALVTLKAVGANGETPGTDQLDAGALRVNENVKTITDALDDAVWIEQIKLAIEKANDNPKVCLNNAFKVQKFMILPTNFSEEQGFLTPTKKMKRPVVEKAFGKQIEMMYASEQTYVRYRE